MCDNKYPAGFSLNSPGYKPLRPRPISAITTAEVPGCSTMTPPGASHLSFLLPNLLHCHGGLPIPQVHPTTQEANAWGTAPQCWAALADGPRVRLPPWGRWSGWLSHYFSDVLAHFAHVSRILTLGFHRTSRMFYHVDDLMLISLG